MAHTPQFVLFGNRLINTQQIKWAGMRTLDDGTERLQVEFVEGGWAMFEPGATLAGLHAAVNGDPY